VRPVRIRDGGQGEYGGRGHVIERPSRKGPAAGRVLPLEALDEGRAFPEWPRAFLLQQERNVTGLTIRPWRGVRDLLGSYKEGQEPTAQNRRVARSCPHDGVCERI
jgi:hypothetical protein